MKKIVKQDVETRALLDKTSKWVEIITEITNLLNNAIEIIRKAKE